MKTKKKISLGLFVCIIAVNIFLAGNTKQSNIDLNQLSDMAIASDEIDPDEEEPIYEPTGLDWFFDIIGF